MIAQLQGKEAEITALRTAIEQQEAAAQQQAANAAVMEDSAEERLKELHAGHAGERAFPCKVHTGCNYVRFILQGGVCIHIETAHSTL